MKLRIISDLHLESKLQIKKWKCFTPQRFANNIILAGDLGDPVKPAYENLLAKQADKHENVLFVAGNHEYYFKEIEETNNILQGIANKYSNVHFLNNSRVKLDGYNFLGTTLWTDKPAFKAYDVKHIRNFSYQNWQQLYDESVKFITENTEPNSVVVTHHSPTFNSLQKYGQFVYSNGKEVKNLFASDLLHLMNPNIRLWAFGHTHINFDWEFNGTQIVSNPFGYNPERDGFKDVVVTI